MVRALTSQIPNLRQFLQQGLFKVRIGKDYLDSRYLEKGMFYQLKDKMTVCFTPVLKGAKRGGLFQVLVGAALIGAAFLTGGASIAAWGIGAKMMGLMGASLLLGGVAQMLTPMPKMSGISDDKEKKQSTAFSNLGNLVAQGRPMPLAYGRIRTGSLIISQGVETMDADMDAEMGTEVDTVEGKPAYWGLLRNNRGQ
ncbi:phage tail protein [Rodentibacter trehalosifermentans]|uniref:Phage tail protein n=1 Tax=Rodentibacter trehalosifermentans TaxID=1908263 RepID=A0A1V3J715_9PAST|nr:phage tail protein [Rodentibacter trehalosifermentans]